MSGVFVRHHQEGHLHIVTLARAEKRNALTLEMTEAIAEAVAAVDRAPACRAVIVEAEGPIFSAGIDVMSLAQHRMESGDQHPARALRRMAERMQAALNRIELTEVPVIGALHGKVMGMGLELALAFDFRIASEELELSLPETRLGLIADVGGTTRLTKLVGPSRTKDMLMTARTLGAQEALTWGLVNRVAPAGGAGAAARALAEQIAVNAPLAVGLAKFVVDHGDGIDRHTQMAIERLAQSQLAMSEDLGEAMSAFMERRTPNFRGA